MNGPFRTAIAIAPLPRATLRRFPATLALGWLNRPFRSEDSECERISFVSWCRRGESARAQRERDRASSAREVISRSDVWCHCLPVNRRRDALGRQHRQAVLEVILVSGAHCLFVGRDVDWQAPCDSAPTAKQWHTQSQFSFVSWCRRGESARAQRERDRASSAREVISRSDVGCHCLPVNRRRDALGRQHRQAVLEVILVSSAHCLFVGRDVDWQAPCDSAPTAKLAHPALDESQRSTC